MQQTIAWVQHAAEHMAEVFALHAPAAPLLAAALLARAAVQLALLARLQVSVPQQARWELPAQVPPMVVEQAEVQAVAERGLLVPVLQLVLLVFPRQRVLEQAPVAPEALLPAEAPNPFYPQ